MKTKVKKEDTYKKLKDIKSLFELIKCCIRNKFSYYIFYYPKFKEYYFFYISDFKGWSDTSYLLTNKIAKKLIKDKIITPEISEEEFKIQYALGTMLLQKYKIDKIRGVAQSG